MNTHLSKPRPLAAACLIAAPLALLAGSLVRPSVPHGDGPRILAELDSIAAHRGAERTALLLLSVAWFLMVPSCIALLRLASEHRSRLAHLGASLFLFAALAKIADTLFKPMLVEMTRSPDRAQMALVVNRLQAESGGKILIVVLIAGFALGVPLLAAGLRHAGQLPTVPAVALGAAGILLFPGQFFEIKLLGILSAALLGIGLTAVARHCLAPAPGQRAETPSAQATPVAATE